MDCAATGRCLQSSFRAAFAVPLSSASPGMVAAGAVASRSVAMTGPAARREKLDLLAEFARNTADALNKQAAEEQPDPADAAPFRHPEWLAPRVWT
jgi:hypothetical protein